MSNVASILILQHNAIKFITPLSTFDSILPRMQVQTEGEHAFIMHKEEKIPFLSYYKIDTVEDKYTLTALLKIRVEQEIKKIALGINAVPIFAEVHCNDIAWDTEGDLTVKMIVNEQKPLSASLLDIKLLKGL